MIEISTKRLIVKTNCTANNGIFEYPPTPEFISLFNLPPAQPENSGFAIYLKSGELIGHIDILFKRKPYELSVGIHEQYRKQGYMKEAQRAVIKWIFENCRTSQVTALVGPITPDASRKLCLNNGFVKTPEGNEEWWILEKTNYKKSSSEMTI